MSPSIRRNRPDLSTSNNRRSELEWSNSNSTANLFLGGVAVRRSWMLDASSQSSSSAPSFASSIAAAAPITTPASHCTPPSSLSPSISAFASAATVLEESGGPRGMQTFPLPSVSVASQLQKDKTKNDHVSITLANTAPAATASATATTILPSAPPVCMSPVTPGVSSHNVQGIASPSPNTLLSSTNSAISPTIVTRSIPPTNGSTVAFDAPQRSQSSLPSPDPSSTSHPSPISIGDRNDTRLSQSVLPSPPPAPAAAPDPTPRRIQLRPRTSQSRGTTAANASPMVSSRRRQPAASSLAQGFQGKQVNAPTPNTTVQVNPGQPRFQTAMAPSPATQASASPASPASQPIPTSFFDQAFWTQSQKILNSIVAGTHGAMVLSDTVERPRVRLLQDACNSRDLLYLTLHQIYCLHTFAPWEFSRLPYLTRNHSAGFEILKQILVDNHRLSGDFLRWSVHFPRPLGVMLQTAEFDKALHQIANCLDLLSKKWAAFDYHVRERVYPPLIDELVSEFGLTSTVFSSTLFLAMSRRIFRDQHQERLRSLFDQNKHNYFKRFQTRVTLEQMKRENEHLIQAYKSLSQPQMSETTSQHAPSIAGVQVATQPLYPHHGQSSISSANGYATSTTTPGPPMPSPQMPRSTTGGSSYSSASAPLSRLTSGIIPSKGETPYPGRRQVGIPSPQLSSQTEAVLPRTTTALSTQPIPNNSPNSYHSLPPRPNLRQHKYNSPYQVLTSQSLGTSPDTAVIYSARGAHPSPVLPARPVPSQQPVHQNAPQQHVSPILDKSSMQHSATHLQGQMQRTQQVQSALQVQQLHQAPQSPPPPPPPPQASTGSNLLLPPIGPLPTNTTRSHPLRVAIHQAQLRDPIIKWNSPRTSTDKDSNLFYYPKSFIIPPLPLGKTDSAFEWQFTLTNADIERLPRIHPRGGGQRSIRTLVDDNQLYRLRCIRISPSVNEVTQHTWYATESVWPSVVYIFVNGTELFVRRKFHNGKDIPLDITEHLREGLNTISLHFIRSAAECNDLVYALGVEIMEISGFAQVKKLAPILSASESRERIQKRLAPSAADDELSIISDYLTVNLVDPFTARIFNIPARGSICEHVECFDFETYILTRASKAGKTGLKENWKCPICGSDARPPNLVIDGFLAEVHTELQRTNRLDDARAIRIKAGGLWELKSDGEDNSSDKGTGQTSSPPSLKRKCDGPLMSPLAQRLKTESIDQGSLTCAESSAFRVIELD